MDEDGGSYNHERLDGDPEFTQDSSEDQAHRVRSDGQQHHGPRASQWARARERRETLARMRTLA